MSAPGEACIQCDTPLVDEGATIRCQKCGFRAYKGGAIIDPGGRTRQKTLVCPLCGGMASADQFEEFKPKTTRTDSRNRQNLDTINVKREEETANEQ